MSLSLNAQLKTTTRYKAVNGTLRRSPSSPGQRINSDCCLAGQSRSRSRSSSHRRQHTRESVYRKKVGAAHTLAARCGVGYRGSEERRHGARRRCHVVLVVVVVLARRIATLRTHYFLFISLARLLHFVVLVSLSLRSREASELYLGCTLSSAGAAVPFVWVNCEGKATRREREREVKCNFASGWRRRRRVGPHAVGRFTVHDIIMR